MISKLTKLLVTNLSVLAYCITSPIQGPATALTLDATERPLIAFIEQDPQGASKVHIQRYDTSGVLDTSFGVDSSATINAEGSQSARNLIVHEDGSISSAGALNNGSNVVYLIARFTSGGLADPSFGTTGVVTILDQQYSAGYGHALFNTGTLIAIAGQVVNTGAILGGISTLSSTGTTGVSTQLDLPGHTIITDIAQSALAPDKAVTIGFSTDANVPRAFVVQYNVSLTGIELDETFSNSGIVQTTPSSDATQYWQLCIDPAGNIVVVGQRNNTQVIERYTPTGVFDASFGIAGSLTIPADFNAVLATVACQNNGNIIAGGYNTTQGIQNLIMLRALSGSTGIDVNFGNQSGAFVLVSQTDASQANDLTIDAAGSVFAAGSLSSELLALKLDPTGLPAIEFGNNGLVSPLVGTNVGATVLRDQKPSGTDGGAFLTAAGTTRDLNTLVGDSANVSLSSNQFTLKPGAYLITASAPSASVLAGAHITLYDVSNATTVSVGTSQPTVAGVEARSELSQVVSVSSDTTFEIRQVGNVTDVGLTALGTAASIAGLDEVYTTVTIIRL